MVIFGPFWPDIAHLSPFDPITSTCDTNIIPYPIGNSPRSLVVPFWNSQNDFFQEVWRHNGVKWSFLAHFDQILRIWALLTPITTTGDTNIIPYPIGNSPGKLITSFWNSQNDFFRIHDVINDVNWSFLAHFDQIPRTWALLAPLLPPVTIISYPIP